MKTLEGYASDWKHFAAWCEAQGRSALPASNETVSLYVTDRLSRGYKVTTVARYVTALRYCHVEAGLPIGWTAEAARLLNGAQRIRQERPAQKHPLRAEQLRQIVDHMRGACEGEGRVAVAVRDRAVLLFGFATALRRSNLVALDLRDLEWVERGLAVTVRREKQDQRGRGRVLGVLPGEHPETCPLAALRAWLTLRGDTPGPVFTQTSGRGYAVTLKRLHGARIAIVVQRAVALIGLDGRLYGAHSMRAGFVTTAIENGENEFVVAAQTGHRALASLRRYYREDPFKANACRALGL